MEKEWVRENVNICTVCIFYNLRGDTGKRFVYLFKETYVPSPGRWRVLFRSCEGIYASCIVSRLSVEYFFTSTMYNKKEWVRENGNICTVCIFQILGGYVLPTTGRWKILFCPCGDLPKPCIFSRFPVEYFLL